MPELPDVTVYLEALEPRILGRTLERVLIAGPSLLRTADPPIVSVENRKVTALRRIGTTSPCTRSARILASNEAKSPR